MPLRGITPETLQIIEFARLIVENMYHDIMVVKQNPLRLAGPLAVPHGDLRPVQRLGHAIGDGAQLPRGLRAHNHKKIGEGAQPPEVEDGEVAGLDGRCGLGRGLGDAGGVDGAPSWLLR